MGDENKLLQAAREALRSAKCAHDWRRKPDSRCVVCIKCGIRKWAAWPVEED